MTSSQMTSDFAARLLVYIAQNPQLEWGKESGVIYTPWYKLFTRAGLVEENLPQNDLHPGAFKISLSVVCCLVPDSAVGVFNVYGLKTCLMYLPPQNQKQTARILLERYGRYGP